MSPRRRAVSARRPPWVSRALRTSQAPARPTASRRLSPVPPAALSARYLPGSCHVRGSSDLGAPLSVLPVSGRVWGRVGTDLGRPLSRTGPTSGDQIRTPGTHKEVAEQRNSPSKTTRSDWPRTPGTTRLAVRSRSAPPSDCGKLRASLRCLGEVWVVPSPSTAQAGLMSGSFAHPVAASRAWSDPSPSAGGYEPGPLFGPAASGPLRPGSSGAESHPATAGMVP